MFGFNADDVGLDRRGGPYDKNWDKYIECPMCDREVPVDDFDHRHGVCCDCLDIQAEAFTKRFKAKLDTL